MPAMRLGGFVIHGNNRETLGDCLDSLLSVCDEVVAVDSCSTDGSAEIVRSRGVRSVVLPWHGYGAARQAAARELANCDYLFFLDSDERLAPEAAEAIAGWRRSNPHLPHYLLPRRDWVQFPSRSFVLRTEWHVRLVRRDAATWKPEMIVHEALPRRPAARLRAPIEHRFMTSTEELEAKQDWYALLWAVQAHASGRRPGRAWLARPVHVLRNCVLKGGLLRGGLAAVEAAWAVSRYHARKHHYLRRLQAGEFRELVWAYADGRLAELFAARERYRTALAAPA